MLEELGARFDLVIEAVSGFGGRLDSLRDEIFGQFAEVGGQVRFLSEQIAASAEMAAKQLGVELKQTNKALANLARKFDRFDDRITVQTRDQDQRLRKIERKG